MGAIFWDKPVSLALLKSDLQKHLPTEPSVRPSMAGPRTLIFWKAVWKEISLLL